ncbi:response regulator transcription factor [Lysinibacillus sphaericus]|uniref:DNA-binding response regulator n=1 Tax=Lysinibacillus sphaericus TaxID=1421 RepID=A0A2S0K2C7_LYSSH|nr:response regulator transcription factor [Lysinibacillus sphaericus]AVK97530.1 DNA-binding response regulator [Lysinibacillus sphaericus]MCS1382465.1 response regulator transcription factor [Lysinibacillus sphaericus]MED4545950.1 response regulator transcription factor [Lysinibacillus sphaericus]TKI20224.1 response regulator transcription factor [Lysinibacillus sphaericus]UDK96314.1 response regulator transcription factor [Lysinibacillus sphaericus]
MEKILIVEDDVTISDLIKLNLKMVGYETWQVYDGIQALEVIGKEGFDLILLDVMLPEMDGFSIIGKIKHKDIPVIFLTAKASIADKVQGLKMGADDYIVKPFESIELLARVEAVLRRYGKKKDILSFKDLEIYLEQMIVKKQGNIIDLTLKEFELINLFIRNKGIALSREKILETVWGYDYLGETRTVDMHIQKLRKKLDLEKEIKTVYKVGYRLED